MGCPGALAVKYLPVMQKALGSVPESRSPGEGNVFFTPVILPGKSHGHRSLEGYSPWGHKESGTI